MLIGWTVVAWLVALARREQRGRGKRAAAARRFFGLIGTSSSVSRKKTCPARRARAHEGAKDNGLSSPTAPLASGGRGRVSLRDCATFRALRADSARIPPRHACGHRRSGSGPEDHASAVAARARPGSVACAQRGSAAQCRDRRHPGAGGFGKTTLLAGLRRRLLAQGCDVGWLLLDARDSGARLVEGMVASLRAATGDARSAYWKSRRQGPRRRDRRADGVARRRCAAPAAARASPGRRAGPAGGDRRPSCALPAAQRPANLHVAIASREPCPSPCSSSRRAATS